MSPIGLPAVRVQAVHITAQVGGEHQAAGHGNAGDRAPYGRVPPDETRGGDIAPLGSVNRVEVAGSFAAFRVLASRVKLRLPSRARKAVIAREFFPWNEVCRSGRHVARRTGRESAGRGPRPRYVIWHMKKPGHGPAWLRSILKYNHSAGLRGHFNPMRTYALEGEWAAVLPGAACVASAATPCQPLRGLI